MFCFIEFCLLILTNQNRNKTHIIMKTLKINPISAILDFFIWSLLAIVAMAMPYLLALFLIQSFTL